MNIYLKAAVHTLKEIIIFLGIILGFAGLFVLNFFILSHYIYEINKVFPTTSVFLIGVLSFIIMVLEIALIMVYCEKVKELKRASEEILKESR